MALASGTVDVKAIAVYVPCSLVPDKYDIIGEDAQILNIAMGPGDEIYTEPGTMMYKGEGIEASCSACDDPCGRCCAGGEKFMCNSTVMCDAPCACSQLSLFTRVPNFRAGPLSRTKAAASRTLASRRTSRPKLSRCRWTRRRTTSLSAETERSWRAFTAPNRSTSGVTWT